MAKGQVRSNRETKKPKKEKPKVAASAHFSARAETLPKKPVCMAEGPGFEP
jgi:hypothetical protein